ncbi:MAG TPA: hypothetical protein VMF67_10305 [Rhizomicrobium sp.]|nr:hypothetical protein [Rhizomicrobium sp.]
MSEAIWPLDVPICMLAEAVSGGAAALLVEKLRRPVTIPHPAATVASITAAITDERFQSILAFPLTFR